MDQPDMTVGSKSWAAKTVCDHYCGEGKPARVMSDGTPLIVYNCPWCSRDDLVLDLALGTVRCSGRGCMAKVDYLGFLAAVEGLDFRSQRRDVQDKRREIIREVRDARAASLTESREQQAVDEELGPREARYTPEQRRAALAELERWEAVAEEERLREKRESWRREDEARREATLTRVTNARAAVTWRELAIALPLSLGILLAVYYGSAPLQDFAHYSPAPEGLGIPAEGSKPDSWPISLMRGVVGALLPDWLVPHRFAVALCLATVVGGVWWYKSHHRRRAASIEEDAYVGVYDRNQDGTILWR